MQGQHRLLGTIWNRMSGTGCGVLAQSYNNFRMSCRIPRVAQRPGWEFYRHSILMHSCGGASDPWRSRVPPCHPSGLESPASPALHSHFILCPVFDRASRVSSGVSSDGEREWCIYLFSSRCPALHLSSLPITLYPRDDLYYFQSPRLCIQCNLVFP